MKDKRLIKSLCCGEVINLTKEIQVVCLLELIGGYIYELDYYRALGYEVELKKDSKLVVVDFRNKHVINN